MASLFNVLSHPILYFERLMAINAASKKSTLTGQIRENIKNGRIDNAK
jgi:hypothetical protein